MHVYVSLSECQSSYFYLQWIANPQKYVDVCPADLYGESGVLIGSLTGNLSRNTLVYPLYGQLSEYHHQRVSDSFLLPINIVHELHTHVFVVLEARLVTGTTTAAHYEYIRHHKKSLYA